MKPIGCNIRAGQVPGGMAGTTYDAKPRQKRSDNRGVIHKAAADWLAKRGLGNQISGFEATAYHTPKPSKFP